MNSVLAVLEGCLEVLFAYAFSAQLNSIQDGIGVGWMFLFALMCMSGCALAVFWIEKARRFGRRQRWYALLPVLAAAVYVSPWMLLAWAGFGVGEMLQKKEKRGCRACAIAGTVAGLAVALWVFLKGQIDLDRILLGLITAGMLLKSADDLFEDRGSLHGLWRLVGMLGAVGLVLRGAGIYPSSARIMYACLLACALLDILMKDRMGALGYVMAAAAGCVILFHTNVLNGIYGTAATLAVCFAVPYVQASLQKGDTVSCDRRLRLYEAFFFLGGLFVLYALYGNGTVRFSGYLVMSLTYGMLWLSGDSAGLCRDMRDLFMEEKEE